MSSDRLADEMTGPVLGVAVIGIAVAALAGQGLDALSPAADTAGATRFVWAVLFLLRIGATLQAALGLLAGFGQVRRAYGWLQVVLVAQVLFGVFGAASWLVLSLEGQVVWGLLSGLAGALLSVAMLVRLWTAERRVSAV